jgi:hypothetical protein
LYVLFCMFLDITGEDKRFGTFLSHSNTCILHRKLYVCVSVSHTVTQSQDGCYRVSSKFQLLSLIGAALTSPGTTTMLQAG